MEPPEIVKTVLEIHRDNLKACKTFEEYRDRHVSYVEYLIERQEAVIKLRQSETNFADKTEWIEKKGKPNAS